MQITPNNSEKLAGTSPVKTQEAMLRKVLLISVGILVILAIALFSSKGKIQNPLGQKVQPTKVISNVPGFQPGTKISLYSQLPPGFPTNVWAGTGKPTHVDVLSRPGGITQTTVVFSSTQTVQAAFNAEQQTLTQAGWKTVSSNSTATSGYIQASQNSTSLILTFAPVASSTQVTFQLAQVNK